MLDGIKNMAQTLFEREFREYHDHKYVTNISNGGEVELVPGGRNKMLSKDNASLKSTAVPDAWKKEARRGLVWA